jgi:hypothetical protein
VKNFSPIVSGLVSYSENIEAFLALISRGTANRLIDSRTKLYASLRPAHCRPFTHLFSPGPYNGAPETLSPSYLIGTSPRGISIKTLISNGGLRPSRILLTSITELNSEAAQWRPGPTS